MEPNLQRRSALAAAAIPFAASLLPTAAQAAGGPAAASGTGVTFETWMRVNTLVQTYADCIDRVDLDGLVQIFTADGTYEYAPSMAANGRDGIRAFLAPVLGRYARTMSFMATPAIRPGSVPGTFSSWTSFIAHHQWKNGSYHAVEGRYVDELAPDPGSGALLIARRRIVSQISEGDPVSRFWLERGS